MSTPANARPAFLRLLSSLVSRLARALSAPPVRSFGAMG
jgi:hypothetical protein